MIRAAVLQAHRYAGLLTALFLFMAGITGSILAFGEEIDVWLNPDLFPVQGTASSLSFDDVAAIVERHDPGARVYRLTGREGVVIVEVESRGDAALDYDEVFVDAASGAILGKRLWGAFRLDPSHFVGFIYRLHDRLHLPGRWGLWIMGSVAIVWMLDCFAGFYLTLPRGGKFFAKWRIAWTVRWSRERYRLNLDLHRAGGLWLWILLFALALSGVSLAFRFELFQPAVHAISPVTPNIFDLREPGDGPRAPRLSFSTVAALGATETRRLGWPAGFESVAYVPGYDVFILRARFQGLFTDEWRWLYLDGQDGRLLDSEWLGQGSPGDLFTEAQFPIHSGRLLGLPGRLLIAFAGIVTALLSVTGIVIWWRKRRPVRRQPLIAAR